VICDIRPHMQLKRATYILLWKRKEVNWSVVEEVVASKRSRFFHARSLRRLRQFLDA